MRADVGVIGGSGLYALLDDAVEVTVTTPYGAPSDALVVGDVDGRSVAFLPRHGADHRYPPHRIPYRANLWALRELGVRQVLAPCAVGSLTTDVGPGALVIPDQLIDRTTGRDQTYYDHGAHHVSFADPYCPIGRAAVIDTAARGLGASGDRAGRVIDGGTMVVIDGPRFSTRAESRGYAALGASIINMTGHPEAVLARELALCYTPIALVTDFDAGVEPGEAVTQDAVFQVFADHLPRLRALLLATVAALPPERTCLHCSALDSLAADRLR